MSSSNRRDFIKKSAMTAGAVVAAPIVKSGFARNLPSNQVNVAVVGFGGRGQSHYKEFAQQKNVKVVALCDVDERLFARGIKAVEKIAGYRPRTYYDIRQLLEDKDVVDELFDMHMLVSTISASSNTPRVFFIKSPDSTVYSMDYKCLGM